jgi:hypothetical protein
MNGKEIINRGLDSVYFRVQRDGKWKNICFSDLTPDERDKVMVNKDATWLRSLCVHLAESIRRIGDSFDIIGDVDDDE